MERLPLESMKLATIFVCFSVLVGAGEGLYVAHSSVVSFKSEISVGAYVNYSYINYGYDSINGQYRNSGFMKITIVSLNSTAFRYKLVESDNRSVISENFSINFTSQNSALPYYNYSIVKALETRANLRISNGTYLFYGKELPVENVTMVKPESLPYGLTVDNENITFDTYSGLILNLTYNDVLNGTLFSGKSYENHSEALSSTNFNMGNANPVPTEVIIDVVAGSVVMATFLVVSWLRRKRGL